MDMIIFSHNYFNNDFSHFIMHKDISFLLIQIFNYLPLPPWYPCERNTKTRMTTSISSEAFEKNQKAKERKIIQKKQKNGQSELLSRCLLLSVDLF